MGTLFIGSEGVTCVKTSLLINTTQLNFILMATHVFLTTTYFGLILDRNGDYCFSKIWMRALDCQHFICMIHNIFSDALY